MNKVILRYSFLFFINIGCLYPQIHTFNTETGRSGQDTIQYASSSTFPMRDSNSTTHWTDPFVHLPGNWTSWYHREFVPERIPFYLGIAGATAVLISVDHQTYVPFKDLYNRSHAFKTFSDRAEFMGQGWFQFGIAGAFALHSLIQNDNSSLQTASQTVEVILSCGAVIQLLKHVTGRETPILASSPSGLWRFFPNQIDYATHVPKYDAFPTGHLATATATLTVIMENYPEAHWIPYIGYPAIACIGVAMVGQGIHWWSDYPLGIAIGYSFGKIVSEHHRPQEGHHTSNVFAPDYQITILHDNIPALSLQWRL